MHHIVLGNLVKQGAKIRAAAIVHDDDFGNARFPQGLHIGRQTVVRLVGGNDDGGFACTIHVLQLPFVA